MASYLRGTWSGLMPGGDRLAAEQGIGQGTVEAALRRLEAMFRLTPPTALILDKVPLFSAAQRFLAGKGLWVPGDISMVSTDYDAAFEWVGRKFPTSAGIPAPW